MPIPQSILMNPIFLAIFATLAAIGAVLVVAAWLFLNKMKPRTGLEPVVCSPSSVTGNCGSHENIVWRISKLEEWKDEHEEDHKKERERVH